MRLPKIYKICPKSNIGLLKRSILRKIKLRMKNSVKRSKHSRIRMYFSKINLNWPFIKLRKSRFLDRKLNVFRPRRKFKSSRKFKNELRNRLELVLITLTL
jgi:hypothetical protein